MGKERSERDDNPNGPSNIIELCAEIVNHDNREPVRYKVLNH